MPRLFNRIICFKVEGEIYDQSTKAEDIIKNYTFVFKDYLPVEDAACYIVAAHKDSRGRITNMSKLPRISKAKKPDTNYFII